MGAASAKEIGLAVPASFVFVGEKRSARAVAMGVRWTDRRLAGRTLIEALEAARVDVARQLFVNLFRDGDGWRLRPGAVDRIRKLEAAGFYVVGMGRRVQRRLRDLEVRHVALTHPAARGAIRRRDRYHEHVRLVIGSIP